MKTLLAALTLAVSLAWARHELLSRYERYWRARGLWIDD